jgi:hypothetical protein
MQGGFSTGTEKLYHSRRRESKFSRRRDIMKKAAMAQRAGQVTQRLS